MLLLLLPGLKVVMSRAAVRMTFVIRWYHVQGVCSVEYSMRLHYVEIFAMGFVPRKPLLQLVNTQ